MPLTIDILKSLRVFSGIVFNEEAHSYKYDGIPCISTTSLISKYKKPFDTENIAKRYAKKHNLSVEEVIADWDYKKNYAAIRGTELHKYAEMKFFGKEYFVPEESGAIPLTKYIDNFYNDFVDILIPIRAELIIGDKQRKICGMVDKLFYNAEEDCIQIWDYKTNKKIEKSNPYNTKMLKGLNHLYESEFNTYSLQLSIYRKIIELNTGIKLGDSYICWVNEDNETYMNIKTDYMEDEVAYMFSEIQDEHIVKIF